MDEATVVYDASEVPATDAQLIAVVRGEGITAPERQSELMMKFAPFSKSIAAVTKQSRGITDGSDPLQRQLARTCRLTLVKERCAVEALRKQTKADALCYGKAVDGAANILKGVCEPEERRLEAIEEYETRREAARIAELVRVRTDALKLYELDPAVYNLALMDEPTWNTVLEMAKKAFNDRQEAIRKAEADRVAKEKADAEERIRIAEENARLKREAEETAKKAAEDAAKAKAEKEALEAKLAAERKAAAEKAAAEAAARAEADRKALAEKEALERKLAAERAAAAAKAKAEAEARAEETRKAEAAKAKAAAEAKAERDALEAKLAAETKARIDAETKAREEAEAAKRKAALEEAERNAAREEQRRAEAEERANQEAAVAAAEAKAMAAPDKEKLMALAARLLDVNAPEMASDIGRAIAGRFSDRLAELVKWLKDEIAAM